MQADKANTSPTISTRGEISLTALLFEAVIMLIAMIISARWVMRRFEVHQTLGSTIPMGLIAIGLLAPAEIAGVLLMRGLSLQEYVGSLATAPGVISLLMFLLFAVMPTLVGRFSSATCQNIEPAEEDLWETDHWDAGHPYRYPVIRIGIESGFGVVFPGG